MREGESERRNEGRRTTYECVSHRRRRRRHRERRQGIRQRRRRWSGARLPKVQHPEVNGRRGGSETGTTSRKLTTMRLSKGTARPCKLPAAASAGSATPDFLLPSFLPPLPSFPSSAHIPLRTRRGARRVLPNTYDALRVFIMWRGGTTNRGSSGGGSR